MSQILMAEKVLRHALNLRWSGPPLDVSSYALLYTFIHPKLHLLIHSFLYFCYCSIFQCLWEILSFSVLRFSVSRLPLYTGKAIFVVLSFVACNRGHYAAPRK